MMSGQKESLVKENKKGYGPFTGSMEHCPRRVTIKMEKMKAPGCTTMIMGNYGLRNHGKTVARADFQSPTGITGRSGQKEPIKMENEKVRGPATGKTGKFRNGRPENLRTD